MMIRGVIETSAKVFISFSLAVIFIIRLFSTSAFRVPLFRAVWKQSTYTLQIRLGALLKVEHLHITIAVGGPFEIRLLTLVICFGLCCMSGYVFHQKMRKIYTRKTSRDVPKRGACCGRCLARPPLHATDTVYAIEQKMFWNSWHSHNMNNMKHVTCIM